MLKTKFAEKQMYSPTDTRGNVTVNWNRMLKIVEKYYTNLKCTMKTVIKLKE